MLVGAPFSSLGAETFIASTRFGGNVPLPFNQVGAPAAAKTRRRRRRLQPGRNRKRLERPRACLTVTRSPMYFAQDQLHHVVKTARVRSSPSVHRVDRTDVERAPLVRSSSVARGSKSFASVSRPNDKTQLMDRAETANADRRHPCYYTTMSSPSSSSSSPVSTTSLVHPTPSEAAEAASQGRSILEYYTQTMPLSAACQSVQKRCTVVGCGKISVSRGLCRGHGGGRRCHFKGGCTKSAQSRSMFY